MPETEQPYSPTLVHLPGTRLTPEVVLHRTLAKAGRIKAVTVLIQWDDDTYDVDWSQQNTSALALGALLLNDTVVKTAQGNGPPSYTVEPSA